MRLNSVLSRLEEATKLLGEVIRDHEQGLPDQTPPLRMSDLERLLKLRCERAHDDWMSDGRFHRPPKSEESALMKLFEELLAPDWAKAEPVALCCGRSESNCECPVERIEEVSVPTLNKYIFRCTWTNGFVGNLMEYGESVGQAMGMILRDNPGIKEAAVIGSATA